MLYLLIINGTIFFRAIVNNHYNTNIRLKTVLRKQDLLPYCGQKRLRRCLLDLSQCSVALAGKLLVMAVCISEAFVSGFVCKSEPVLDVDRLISTASSARMAFPPRRSNVVGC